MTTDRTSLSSLIRQPILLICAWCARTKIGTQWEELRGHNAAAAVSHGICPTCYETQLAKAARNHLCASKL